MHVASARSNFPGRQVLGEALMTNGSVTNGAGARGPARIDPARIDRRAFIGTSLAAAATASLGGDALAAGEWGMFKGRVVAEWLPDGRNMRLTEPFEYIGPTGRNWPVPKGTTVDGASIPSYLWSLIGGPFEGLYRAPSVVHDYYCEVRTRKYEDVHQCFHDAMLCAGVGSKRAWLMYEGVANFGPRWADPKIDPRCETVDANYDFERCARNEAPPKIEYPKADKAELLRFLDQASAQADPNDLAKLRAAIEKQP
jgi:hypothetical protein